MQPSEFWRLPVCDWWAELDAHIVEARAMREKLDEVQSGKKGGNVFSRAEWERARQEHAAKVKAKHDRT